MAEIKLFDVADTGVVANKRGVTLYLEISVHASRHLESFSEIVSLVHPDNTRHDNEALFETRSYSWSNNVGDHGSKHHFGVSLLGARRHDIPAGSVVFSSQAAADWLFGRKQ